MKITKNSKSNKENNELLPLRHSAEHILHMAVEMLYPEAKKVMGPAIENGFYGDFDSPERISAEDLPRIEQKMEEISKQNLPIKMREASQDELIRIFKDNKYKLELIKEHSKAGEKLSVCEIGKKGDRFYDIDLCAGPHVKSTEEIKVFKLLSVAGAYWRGDEKNKMLTRIYGTAFKSQKDLDEYLEMVEEAKKRDHRKLGKELDLFVFSEEVGGGLPLWTPNGTIIREELEKWAKETEEKWGYKRVATPHIAKETLYKMSGHLPYYKDDMYPAMEIEGENYYLKGMNCPHHHMIYKSRPHSYRELPIRFAEYGTVYRYELSGALFGLMRVRSIAQNDAHIYCTYDQAVEEFVKSMELYDYYYKTLGLTKKDYYAVIGLPSPEKKDKYHGNKEMWDLAEKLTRQAIEKFDMEYTEDVGGAAFYGPKIDINIRSSTNKEYGISTAQLDLYMPTRFGLEYTDKDGTNKLCAVIHRAPLGSHERFIGFLIEHFGGAFPVWLSPTQAQIIPIGERNIDYAKKIKGYFDNAGMRSEIDDRAETMQAKLRDAQLKKVPYMVILGEKEEKQGNISVRLRSGETHNNVKTEEAVEKMKNIHLTKSLQLW